MLSKSFKSGKCKTSLKLAISRIKLLKNRREIQVKQLRRELAQLLETGQEQTARIRVEHVIREEKTMSAYDLIEIYCELIVARMPIIESQKSCPIDLKEAISSVIFASPRCADIPELIDARKQFVAKYGKEFVTSALELRPDCGVNRMIVEKLSAKTPGTETKMKILTAIAKEHEIKWDSKPLEEELQKPEDQLNGSSGFTDAKKMPVEPLNINFSPNTSQTESASIVYHTDVPSKPTSVDSSSQANLRTTPLVPPLIPNESRESDGKAGVWEIKDSYPREEAASFEQPTWRMEFKDAASAAKVAAESAERASIAARAAAELASRGNISRQNTYEPNGSSLHSGDERPKRAVSSKLKGKINESANMEYDQGKVFQGMKEEVHQLPRDELREEISHHSSTSDEGMEYSSQMYNVRKFDSFRVSFSRMEMGNLKKHDEAGFVEKNVEVNYDRLASAGSMGTFDDETIWVPPIDEHQTGNHDIMGHTIHEIDAGERLFSYDSKEHVSIDYPAAVFDEYDPEPANDKENLFDSFKKKRNDQSPIFAPSTSSINSNIFSSSRRESHPVSVEKIPSSKFDDSMSAAFDDSDGLASESDDDMSSFQQIGTTQNSSLQHEESDLGGDLLPREKLQPSSSTKAKSLLGAEEKSHLQVPTPVGAKDPEMPEELASGGNFGLNFERLTGGLRNRGYSHSPYTGSSVVDSPVSSLETLGSTSGTNQINFPRDKPFGSSLIEDDSLNPIMPGASTNLESEKAKGSLSDEYNQGSRSNETFSTDRSEEDATGFSVKQSVSNQEKSRRYRGGDPNPSKQVPYDYTNNPSEFPTVSEVINQKLYDEKPRTKAYKELSSRMSKADFDSDGEVEERDSQVNMENHGNASSSTTFKLSRRTKDFTLKGGANLPRSTGYSDMSNSKTESRATRRSFAPELPSQTVDKAAIVQGKQNRKSAKPNSSAESMPEFSVHEENKKTTEGIPDPATTSINSGNSKPSDFGGGKKLQETASQKVSHVHPKLPDYETFAAHFQSLRSNRRQL